jgi:hypothetical protein
MNNPENTGSGKMMVKKLTLHKETVRELAGSRDGALSGNSGSGGTIIYGCTVTCHGRTCNKRC